MAQAWLMLFKSRKFWMTIGGTALIAALHQLNIPNEIIGLIAGLFGVNIGAIAYEDGKAKEGTASPTLR